MMRTPLTPNDLDQLDAEARERAVRQLIEAAMKAHDASLRRSVIAKQAHHQRKIRLKPD